MEQRNYTAELDLLRGAGEKCFQVREHATREWRLRTEVARKARSRHQSDGR